MLVQTNITEVIQSDCVKVLADFIVSLGNWTIERDFIWKTEQQGEDIFVDMRAIDLKYKDSAFQVRVRAAANENSQVGVIYADSEDTEPGDMLGMGDLRGMNVHAIKDTGLCCISLGGEYVFAIAETSAGEIGCFGLTDIIDHNGEILDNGISYDMPGGYQMMPVGKVFFQPLHVTYNGEYYATVPKLLGNPTRESYPLMVDQYGKNVISLSGPPIVARG